MSKSSGCGCSRFIGAIISILVGLAAIGIGNEMKLHAKRTNHVQIHDLRR